MSVTSRRIVISGLTAAGKTTHAMKLARFFDLEYFSSSELLTELTGGSGAWSPAVDIRRRANLDIDRELDSAVLREFQQRSECVFDAWALPWFIDRRAICIWIESDFASRVRKCSVSRLEAGETPLTSECRDVVSAKDLFSRERFRENHRFDLFHDRSPFDLVVDNTRLIPQATLACAERGIAAFHREIIASLHELRLASGRDIGALSRDLLRGYVREDGETVSEGGTIGEELRSVRSAADPETVRREPRSQN